MHCDDNGGYILQDKIGLHVYIYMKCIGSYDISSLYLQSCNIISKTFLMSHQVKLAGINLKTIYLSFVWAVCDDDHFLLCTHSVHLNNIKLL